MDIHKGISNVNRRSPEDFASSSSQPPRIGQPRLAQHPTAMVQRSIFFPGDALTPKGCRGPGQTMASWEMLGTSLAYPLVMTNI